MDNLTPTLNDSQIKENIDALLKQDVSRDKIQNYVDNYYKASDGNYVLKSSQAPAAPADNADHSWVTGDKHFVPQLGDAIFGKADPNYQPQGAVNTALHIAAAGVRPVLNLPTSLLRGVEDTTKVIPNAIDLTAKQGVGGIAQGAANLTGNLLSPLTWLGSNIAGGISSGIRKVTGYSVDPNSEAAFGKTVGQVSHPLDTATDVAKTVYSTSQDQPMIIPLALQGAGKSLSKMGINNVGPIATSDVIGSVGRGVIDGTKAIGDAVLKPVLAPLQDAAFNKRVDEFNKVLNPAKGLAASEAKYEKNSPQFAAQLEQEGVKFPFGKDGRGRLDTTAAQDNVDAIAQRDNATMGRLLQSSGINTNLDDIAANAKAEAIRTYKGTAQDAALQHIDDEFAAYKRQYAGQGTTNTQGQFIVPGEIANEIKQDLWSKSKFPALGSPLDQTKAGTSFLMGQSIKDSIQEAVGGDNIVGRLNQRLGDIASLQKMLQKAQGGAIHGGFASRMAGRIVGAIAGSAGGPVGSISGAITGDMISEALNNPMRPLSWAQAVLSRASSETPDLLKEVEARIGKNAQEILNRKLLPSGDQSVAPAYTGNNPLPEGSGNFPQTTTPNQIQLPSATPPPSGTIQPTRPGGLYEYLQNQKASQKAAGINIPATGDVPTPPVLNVSTAKDIIGAYNPKFDELLDNVKTSVTDWNRGIETDDIPFEKIYKPNGEFQPAALDHVLSDMSAKMNNVRPGLGYEFKANLDITNPTPQNLVEQAQTFIKNAVSNEAKINTSNVTTKDIIMNDNAPFNTRASVIESGQSQAEKNAVAAKAAVKQNIKYPAAGLSTRDITKLHPEDHDLLARGYEAYKTGDLLSSSEELALNRLLNHIGVSTDQSIAKVRTQMLAVLNGDKSFKGTDLRNLTGPKSNFGRTQSASIVDSLPLKNTAFGRK